MGFSRSYPKYFITHIKELNAVQITFEYSFPKKIQPTAILLYVINEYITHHDRGLKLLLTCLTNFNKLMEHTLYPESKRNKTVLS